jgi:maltose O-acetyltransferase
MKKKIVWLMLYCLVKHLPVSYCRIGGGLYKKIRLFVCSHIFEYCGHNVNIEKGAEFGFGRGIRIGDNSGLGINCRIPEGSIIGNDVMMGPNCYVFDRNHVYERTDIPMRLQGFTKSVPVIIDDDVWIGRDVTIMVGRHISKGTIVAACSVVTKDFPPYSVIGGNPAKLIRSRVEVKDNNNTPV